MVQRKAFDVFADYHQFYLFDPGADFRIPDTYTAEDCLRRVKTGPHTLVIQPERNMTVPVAVEIYDHDPGFDPAAWDHIAEASLHLPTGQLTVNECIGLLSVGFEVPPGWYRVRSLGGGFGTIDRFGLEGGDHYLAVLWPAPPADVRVVKQWVPAD